MKMISRLEGLGLLSLLVFCLLSFQTDTATKSGSIEIIRDKWGIAHVFSDTDSGAMYGLGYCMAEDRAFQMYYNLRLVQGRSAELLGNVKKDNGKESTVDHDTLMRTIGFYRYAKKAAVNFDSATKELVQLFCNGVNDYIKKNPGKLSYLFKKFDLVPEPWTPADCIASWWNLAKFFSGFGTHDLIPYHQKMDGDVVQSKHGGNNGRGGRGGRTEHNSVYDDSAAVIQREDVSEEWIKEVSAFADKAGIKLKLGTHNEGKKFSHAWVVGGKKTTTGSSVLCSDPQTPVRNPSLWYEFHISSPTLNTRGVGIPGTPVLLIGWNENVAWGMTALGADQADLFFLKTDSSKPNKYLFDGEWKEMRVFEESIEIKGGDTKTLTLRETHHGPVVTSVVFDARKGEEVALKYVPLYEADPIEKKDFRDTFIGAFAMMRSRDVVEFSKAIEGWRFPSVHVVFGDKKGDIGYSTLAAIPVRSKHSVKVGFTAFDGSDSKSDWQGILPYSLLPHAINPKKGWFASGNHRAIGTFYEIPLGLSTGSTGHTTRSWRLYQMIEEKDKLTPEDVLNMHFDSRHAAKSEIVRLGYHIRDVMKENLHKEALNTLEYLEEWFKKGAQSDLSVKGTELVNLISTYFRATEENLSLINKYGSSDGGLCNFLNSLRKRVNDNPNAVLNDDEIIFIEARLADAWTSSKGRYGPDQSKWNEKAREFTKREKIEYYKTLDGFDSLDHENDLDTPELTRIDGGGIGGQPSQSYTHWIPLHDVDSAMSLLPIGISEQPGSEFRTVTYDMWRKSQLHPAPITRKAVEKYESSRIKLTR
ncbi:MAG: penicillin acylase family protein [Planctomycetes bacterium]|nr:penicillin acylase family protein [Planctomycetota bacterium]